MNPNRRPPALLGIPFDLASTHLRGARGGPAAIRAALRDDAGNPYAEDGTRWALGEELADAGDVEVTDDDAGRASIEHTVSQLVTAGHPAIVVGGDHAITYPILRGIAHAGHRPTLLYVDAHPDLYDDFAGARFTHASPVARIAEDGLVSRIVQVGIRATTPHQREQALRFGVETISMADWMRGTRPVLDGPVYLSLDLDGLDPAFAPGVSHPEPGGLSTRDVLGMIAMCRGALLAADVVECNPTVDVRGLTAMVGAKMVREIAAAMA